MRVGLTAAVIVLAGTAGSPCPVAALDLSEALRQATVTSPALAARAASAEAARRRASAEGAWPSPMVELGVINVPTTGRLDEDPMTMKMLGLSQRVPLFGANRIAGDAASAEAAGEIAAAAVARLEIWGMTYQAYADAYYAGALARLAGSHGTVLDHMVQSARARYESGGGRLDDLLLAQAEQARAGADVALFGAEERAARARLDALRGVAPGAATDSLAPLPVAAVPAAPEPWLAAVTPSHPELQERQAEADRYRLSASAARRAQWPDLELRGSYGWREPINGLYPQEDMFSVTAGFTLPIFGRERSDAASMDAMARARDADVVAADRDLRARVTGVHATAAAAQRTVHLLADTVLAIQRRAVEASWVSYRAGTTDLWRVFESVHALYAQEIAVIRARQELAGAQAQMLALTGRGDVVGVALPETSDAPERGER
jgi:outer membrane protein TolC